METQMSSYLLRGDFSFPYEFVKRGFRNLKVSGQLFNGQYLAWFFSHRVTSQTILFHTSHNDLFMYS